MFAKVGILVCILALSKAENLGLHGYVGSNFHNRGLVGHGVPVYGSSVGHVSRPIVSQIGQPIVSPISQPIITQHIARPIINPHGHSVAQQSIGHPVSQHFISIPITSSYGHGVQVPITRTIVSPVGHGILGSPAISNPHGSNGFVNTFGLW